MNCNKVGMLLLVLASVCVLSMQSALGLSFQAEASGSQREPAGQDLVAKPKSNAELRDAAVVRPEAEYPALARAARVSGRVEVEVVVDREGRVTSVRAISGHPLLKDFAIVAARRWRFDATKLSQWPTTVVGRLTFVFDLVREENKERRPANAAQQWETRLKICRQELVKPSPDDKTLAMSLANLAAAVYDENTIDEALSVFEEAEKQKKVPGEARPYYAQLLLEKYDSASQSLQEKLSSDSQQSAFEGELSSLGARFLSPALQIFLQAYADEVGKDWVDARKLFDIGARIASLYERRGRKEEAEQWLQSMLSSPRFPDGARAMIAYRIAVQLWKKSYDLTINYVGKNEPVPEADYPLIRQLVREAYSYIQTAHELDPKYANAWFYEKLIAVEEYRIEPDPEKKKAIQARAIQLQDRYLALMEEQKKAEQQGMENTSGHNYDKPYASGLPSLNFSGFAILAPPTPPPPPPPPPLAPAAKPPNR